MERDSVDERVLADRARLPGTLAQRLAVALAGGPDILPAHRGERNELDRVNLDLPGTDPVPP